MLIDTHAHLDDEAYEGNLNEVIENFKKEGGKLIINPSYDRTSAEKALMISREFEVVYAALGIHPHDAQMADEEFYDFIIQNSDYEKVVAVGEIGLDYYYDNSPRVIQREVFKRQMEIAVKKELPVIIHSRDAHLDTYNILESFKGKVRGVMHSYSGSWEMAKRYLDLGYYISLSGPLTFKNSRKLPEVAANTPLDRILVETDSPYLTPVPYRGRTNNPSYVRYVAEKIADIKEITFEKLMEHVEINTFEVFEKIKR
ncbi:TatD family hydrolase [Alkalibacter saccharofermentans]|uniref:TatD DNase family protein n=1 Tax=Alkalibacter saccharofermentans DSM 14828 TaxID=1120975 RepID=A0A1M4THS6_9FIRM|nr:TatD family hydrolase [Alkalibacter saccharofermentans]SHE43884.1 TatD DNase family protein [Alkalibacter saccharofermentans DSM 14828]